MTGRRGRPGRGKTPKPTGDEAIVIDDSDDDGEVTQVLTPITTTILPPSSSTSTEAEPSGKTWKDFAVSGKMDNGPLMVIDIEGFGPLTFPIYSEKIVEVLRPFLVKSDYAEGRSKKRIYDESVRLSSEVPSSRLKFINPSWDKYLKDILLPKIGGELGFDHLTTRTELRKLLIYEKDSFFSSHSDAMIEEGQFATLIIQLPSLYSGGQLRCSYGRIQKVFDYSTFKEKSFEKVGQDSDGNAIDVAVNLSDILGNVKVKIQKNKGTPDVGQKPMDKRITSGQNRGSLADFSLEFELPLPGTEMDSFYTAFYLDVEHEVKKVTSGVRSCLIYSLIDTTAGLQKPPEKEYPKEKPAPASKKSTKAKIIPSRSRRD